MDLINLFSIYKNWDDKNLKNWRLARERGALYYTCVDGVIIYGGVSCSTFISLKLATGLSAGANTIQTIAIWFIGAVLYGLVTWYATEKSYQRSNLKPAKD